MVRSKNPVARAIAMGRLSPRRKPPTGFLERTIKNTFSYSSDPRFGVMFERDIGLLESREVSKSFSLL